MAAGLVGGCERGAADRENDARKTSSTRDTTGVGRYREKDTSEWDDVRAEFALSDDVIHLSALLISSHPRPVREAIEEHRRKLDADPVTYLEASNRRFQNAAREAAGRYLGIQGSDIALTDSTTMGLGTVYNGLRLSPGDEILSTDEDYYATHESIRLAAERTGAEVRKIALHDGAAKATQEELVDRIIKAIRPATRVLAVTWVHSSTGLKLPLPEIARALEAINAERDEGQRVLFCVDAVHGFGVEDVEFADLGCDFFIAGCHKWLFGPRGTGIVGATRRGWRAVMPTIPSFIADAPWDAWARGGTPSGPTTAARMMPGGFKPFEHQWAIAQAFEFHLRIGKAEIAARTHELAGHLKDGLAGISGVTLHTPQSSELSAGIVSFDVDGVSPGAAVARLKDRGIIASVAPYAVQHVRLTPSIRNTAAEIDAALRAVREIAG